jgi:hypothetical protein
MNEEHWIQKLWRPAMGWTYMAINIFDFVIAPAFVLFLKLKGVQIDMWKSLTLDNGGFIHLAFGAILGVSAYGRTQEKTATINSDTTTVK